MEYFMAFILSNFTLSFLIVGFLFAVFSFMGKPKPLTKQVVIHAFFSYFLLFAFGFAFFYNFVMHVFFGGMAARFIGWSQSPFQAEVGFASLGFSIVSIMAFWKNLSFRAAAVIAPAFFFWGAAGGHIYQMIVAHNFAPGNAGIMFWTDILFPVIGFWFLWMQYKYPIAVSHA